MTITIKPAGRGNWGALTLRVSGSRASYLPFAMQVGDTFEMAGITWRVCAIKA